MLVGAWVRGCGSCGAIASVSEEGCALEGVPDARMPVTLRLSSNSD